MPEIEPMSDEELNLLRVEDEPALNAKEWAALKARLDATKAERDRYKAVVERLPRYADTGNPILPGDAGHIVSDRQFETAGGMKLIPGGGDRFVVSNLIVRTIGLAGIWADITWRQATTINDYLSEDIKVFEDLNYAIGQAAESCVEVTNAESQHGSKCDCEDCTDVKNQQNYLKTC